MASEVSIQITVVYSPRARVVHEIALQLPDSSTVLQAIEVSGLLLQFPAIDLKASALGVWGRKSGLNQSLRENDRVEIYRALSVDPKLARRQRFAKQGARSAGLFANQRAGAKAGY